MAALSHSSLESYLWLDTPVWVFDLERRSIPWSNQAGLEFWGASTLEELQARDFSALNEATETRLRAVMAENAAGRTVREQWTLYPRGKAVTLTTHSANVVLPDGRQAILYEGTHLLRHVEPTVLRGVEALQHTSVVIAMYRADGRPLMRNPAGVRTFGPFDPESQRDEFSELFADPAVAGTLRGELAGKESYAGEALMRTLAGPRWHALGVRWVRDPVTAEQVLLVNARDICELKQTEKALIAAREAADSANRLKGEFLANMSHEIRTPMNGVLGMLNLVLETALAPEQREYLLLARTSAQSLLDIINDLLDFSKIEAGHLALDRRPFALGEAVSATVAGLSLLAREKGLRLELELDPALPLHVVGDALRLRQVLLNLLGNAIKFTERGEVRCTVTLSAPRPGDAPGVARVAFAVKDTGIGITPEAQKTIFLPFVQADGSSTRRFSGTGLGLSISSRLVGLMGGAIELESVPGQGSRFSFEVPLEVSAVAPGYLPLPTPLPRAGDAFGRGRPVLLAEDNLVNQRLAARLLEKLGFAVTVAKDGQEACEAAARAEFAAVLMDVQMPVMGGFEATAEIRQREAATGRRVPVVAMTANAMEGDRDRCLAAGMDDYVPKPVDFRELARVLRQVLGED